MSAALVAGVLAAVTAGGLWLSWAAIGMPEHRRGRHCG